MNEVVDHVYGARVRVVLAGVWTCLFIPGLGFVQVQALVGAQDRLWACVPARVGACGHALVEACGHALVGLVAMPSFF